MNISRMVDEYVELQEEMELLRERMANIRKHIPLGRHKGTYTTIEKVKTTTRRVGIRKLETVLSKDIINTVCTVSTREYITVLDARYTGGRK